MSLLTENAVLNRWNALKPAAAAREVLPCCGSRTWARRMAAERPFADLAQLLAASDRVWKSLEESDWRQAFLSHPRIGQPHAPSATARSLAWSAEEQQTALTAPGAREQAVKLALAEANLRYEQRFGRIFIVCAAGKSAAEILSILNARMNNIASMEWFESGEQQRQITQLRLRRWLEAY